MDGDIWGPVLGWTTGMPSLHLNLDDAGPYEMHGSAAHITTPVGKNFLNFINASSIMASGII